MEADKKEFVPKHYSILSDILFFADYFKKEEPMVLVFSIMEILLKSAVPLFGIWLPKLAVDLVEKNASVTQAAAVLGGFVLLMIVFNGASQAVQGGKYHLYNEQRTNVLGMLFLKSLRIRYADVEAGEIKKVYMKARGSTAGGDWSAISMTVSATTDLCINLLSFALYSTVIGFLNFWMLLILIGLSLINYRLRLNHIKKQEAFREENATAWRHFGSVSNAMGNPYGAKDVRIFAMQHWLLQLRDVVIGELTEVQKKYQWTSAYYARIHYALSALRDLGAYAWLLYQASEGKLTAGEFVLYFGAITGFSTFVNGIMNSLSALRGAANDTDYLRAYLELPEEDRASGSRHIDELTLPLSIEFQDVSFSYKRWKEDDVQEEVTEESGSGSEGKCIFNRLNLNIRAGEKIALVGVNGAGKTTLVKLLCGMYDPDGGQILINGIDRNEFPREELYKLFSVVFQETLILPFTVGENLSMDRIERVDEKKAWDCLERAGLGEFFREQNIGIRRYMTKQLMKDGIELSGGQKQRFLLARALYKDAPILVLDEPTAALDPIAESQVYDSYRKYTEGKTAIFISHRLASTRFSDRIVLIEDGRILEQGSHEELIRAAGPYAEMFKLQSSYYSEEKEDGNGSDE
ncbi:MAG: ABC transporter ATP-binding protein [Lachnospiraceae bacterium]|nr:ABC transporter ATP-binding protein [Lachnospiraceae bacterium]